MIRVSFAGTSLLGAMAVLSLLLSCSSILLLNFIKFLKRSMNRCVSLVCFVLLVLCLGGYLYLSAVYSQDQINAARESLMDRGVRGLTVQTPLSALRGRLGAFSNIAKVLGHVYQTSNVRCYELTERDRIARFLMSALALQGSWIEAMRYTYMSYEIPNSAGLWGDCGCEAQPSTSSLCSFVDSAGFAHTYEGANFSRPVGNPVPQAGTEHELYTKYIRSLTSANSSGVWHKPYFYNDTLNIEKRELITFTLPLAFGLDGKCILAASVDFTVQFVNTLLKTNAFPESDVVVVDLRDNGTFVASKNQDFAEGVFEPTKTPSASINRFVGDVIAWNGKGLLYMNDTRFVASGYEYNVVSVMENWALYERTLQSHFFVFRDKQQVSFGDMYETNQMVVLLSLAAFMLLLIFLSCFNGFCGRNRKVLDDYPLNS